MNNLNLLKLNAFKCIRAVFFGLSFMLVSAIPVYSLDWKDKEWIEAGCPLEIFGQWVSIGFDTKNKKLLSVEQNKIRVLINQIPEQEYFFNKKDIVSDGRFVSLKLLSNLNDKKNNLYWKIRPHLVNTESGSKILNISRGNCLIKVFEFKSKNNAKLDKYLQWDIYKLKK